MWTLANHPRVPPDVRKHFQTWKPAKDEFTDHANWPHQLYVREARRMISDYVMTQHNCQGRETVGDPVGLAAYTMDSHNIQRYVTEEGRVQNEGDVQVGGFSPYPIAYRSIRPKKAECTNLLVPVCLSSSHIAYGSIRMEPVFMVLGQSSATAAVQAIEQNVAVQDIDSERLRQRLLKEEQVLEWTGPKRTPPVDPRLLPGIVLDNREAKLTGDWPASGSIGGYVGGEYLHDNNAEKGRKQAVFMPKLEEAGVYEVRIAYTPHSNRATNVPVSVWGDQRERRVVRVNMRSKPQHDGFHSLGRFHLGPQSRIVISNEETDGHVIVDAVQLLPVEAK
ncbi:MAG: FAD-dependent oxidoreductase, partial [Planctomycetaceae bacterium]